MSVEQDDTNQHGSAPPTATSSAPPYEPPAIAWDEPFAVTIAASCAFSDPFSGCVVRPEV